MKKIYHSLILLLSIVGFATTASAQTRTDTLDINRRTRLQLLSVNRIGAFAFDHSPAAALFRYHCSRTEVDTRLDWRQEDEAYISGEGDGELKGSFNVESYLRLNERSAAFARVGYTNGVRRNVVWNTSSDLRELYPYIVADSIGGDLDTEQYYFEGGYTRYDGRINYGISGAYRALHEYRQVDPRPRNQTSDLKLNLSAGYLFARHTLTADLGLRIYKQDQSVSYYNQNGVNTIQFHMLGLGAYHGRFSGSGSNALATNFKGTGYTAALVLAPRTGRGWSAMLRYEGMTITQYIKSQNNLPLTELETQTLTGSVAYRSISSEMNWGVEAEAEYSLRQGTEAVSDSGSNQENNILERFTMYRNHLYKARVKGLAEWKGSCMTGSLMPELSYFRSEADYLYPYREMTLSWLTAGIEAKLQFDRKRWLWDTTLGAGYTPMLDNSLTLPDSMQTDPIHSIITLKPEMTRAFGRLTTDYAHMKLGLRSQYSINRTVAVFAAVEWQKRCFKGGLTDDAIRVAVGVNF